MAIDLNNLALSLNATICGFAGLLVGATVGYVGVLIIVIGWVGYHYVEIPSRTPSLPPPTPTRRWWWPWG
jgi:hypothetical protein